MEDFNKVIQRLIIQLEMISYKGDLSDIGNEIGVVIGKHIEKNKMGCELEDFMHGIKHGISLVDGTHGNGDARILTAKQNDNVSKL